MTNIKIQDSKLFILTVCCCWYLYCHGVI